MPARSDRLTVNGSTMRCYVSLPEGEGLFPGVAVAMHAPGLDEFIQGMCDRLAEAGFAAAAPDLYHRQDPNSGEDALARMAHLRDDEVIADMRAAIEHLRAQPTVAADRLGVTGFCMGGRIAYLMAAEEPSLKAAVVFYGGNIMVSWGAGPTPFERSERIGCPVLGLFGEEDTNPSPSDVAKIDAELSRLGKVHEFQSYAGAGHAFMNWLRPSYREDAARDAWEKCLAWFRRHL